MFILYSYILCLYRSRKSFLNPGIAIPHLVKKIYLNAYVHKKKKKLNGKALHVYDENCNYNPVKNRIVVDIIIYTARQAGNQYKVGYLSSPILYCRRLRIFTYFLTTHNVI